MRAKLGEYSFAKIYEMYAEKAEKKGRTRGELEKIICWLTGYNADGLKAQIAAESNLEAFINEAPEINPSASKITGRICGVKVEEIEDPFVQKVRWMDKIVDELAKGKAVEKIMR